MRDPAARLKRSNNYVQGSIPVSIIKRGSESRVHLSILGISNLEFEGGVISLCMAVVV